MNRPGGRAERARVAQMMTVMCAVSFVLIHFIPNHQTAARNTRSMTRRKVSSQEQRQRGLRSARQRTPTDRPLPLPKFSQSAPLFLSQFRILVRGSTGVSAALTFTITRIYRFRQLPNMANNASVGRFYAFTGDTSAPLPPSTTPPDHPFRRHSSGSDSVSDDGRSAIGHSYHVEQAPQGQGILGGQFGAHDVAGFAQIRADPAFTTLYRDDTPFVPNVSFQPPLPSNFAPPGPDAHFPSTINNFNSVMPPSMTQTTPYGVRHFGLLSDSTVR